jgi:polysaccharide pyruvyl transferase WcaK-like protein/glycosyltransferase involved in cell wall biosynthesis
MHVPRVSIGLAVYNGEKYLRLAVESILEQDYTDFELIISDNASTDATQEICEELTAKDARIRYSRNATNIGASKNYQRVFELSQGEFFTWLDHDDLRLPGFLRRCVDVLDEAPATVVLVAPRTEMVDEEGVSQQIQLDRLHTTHALPHQRVADVIRNVSWAAAQYGLFRSAALRKTRLIDGFWSSDHVLLLELAILGEIWEIPETLVLKRDYPGRCCRTNKSKAEFAAWFDPTRKDINSRKMLMVEHARSIARLPLAPVERLLCFWTAFSVWFKKNLTESGRFGFLARAISAINLVRLLKDRQKREVLIRAGRTRKVCFFGGFGSPNFGNELTLQTILEHLRHWLPKARVACVCTGPEALRATQNIETIPISPVSVEPWRPRTRLARLFRRFFIGVPSEFCGWLDAFKKLKGTSMFIVPGTGLLTDAYGLRGWGPYSLFKWSLIAKLRGCKVLFVSVGAGPIYSGLGRYFIKSALSVANFRSYRDEASMAYLRDSGVRTNSDRVYPDLVFSLPEAIISRKTEKRAGRPAVGLGVMQYQGKYSIENPTGRIYQEYLNTLVAFAGWLLAHDYDIILLIGDPKDWRVAEQLKSQLKATIGTYDEERILGQAAPSLEQLLTEIAASDLVVATRFHNVLLSLVFNKPTIAISFHHKSVSLMRDMGLAEYCHDINDMNVGRLIEQFQRLETNAEKLKIIIRQRNEQSRKALDDQYKLIFKRI